MAAHKPLTREQQDRARAGIQTTKLIKRLNMFALGETDPAAIAKDGDDAKPVEMDANRIRAVDILLRKSLPDLSSIVIAGDPDNPITLIERRIVGEKVND
jgi:hypothetical protein